MGLLGLDDACRVAATRAQDPVPEALAFLGVLGDPKDLGLLQNAIVRPPLAEAALAGLGALGSAAAIPALLEAMADETLGPFAARALVRVTGAPEALGPGAKAWWSGAKARFTPEGRWQSGHDVAKTPLGPAFRELPLETRLDLLLSARARDPRQTRDLELELPAARQ